LLVVPPLALWLSACSGQPTSVAIGFASNVGSPSAADVAQLALDASRKPGSPRIVVVVGDSTKPVIRGGPLPSEVRRAIQFVENPNLVALVGPGGSREALQTAPVYRDAGVVNIIPTGTSTRLRELGPLSFQLAPNDSIQGEFIGEFVANKLRARSAALVYLPDEYGVGLAAGSEAALAKYGVKLTSRLPVRPGQVCLPHTPASGYDDVVRDMLTYGEPDVVVLATRTVETSCIASAVHARSPRTLYVAGDGALVQHDFVRWAGPALDSIYLVAFWHEERDDSASRAFVQQFRTIVKREPRHDDAMYYDAVMVAAQAVREGGSSRGSVAKYLSALGRRRPPYRGITGPIAFTPGSPRPLLITRLRNGQPEIVTP
jgi:branched-chain amino acid transport system substrate-binding protein